MFRRIEALHYRSLCHINVGINDFQVLVGPNASGKSSFLDVIRFFNDFLRNGLEYAVTSRAPNIKNLVWMQEASRFELAAEIEIPEHIRIRLSPVAFDRARYEIAVGMNDKDELVILNEILWIYSSSKPQAAHQRDQRSLFPAQQPPPNTILVPAGKKASARGGKTLVKKTGTGNDYFVSEVTKWNNLFRLGPQRPALANLPEDEEKFPVSIWVKKLLMEGVDFLLLSSEAMRRSSPPGSPRDFRPDGSNLPYAIDQFRHTEHKSFNGWLEHVRTALPDVLDIEIIERPEDKHKYLQVVYRNGLKAPSWTVSDGTLRLLALTLVGYLHERQRIYLIEEPENGIHPRAIETVFRALSSAYESQILCASHSPVFVSLAKPEQLLCFARNPDGSTDIINGAQHPNLRDWKGRVDLGSLFAAGVLE